MKVINYLNVFISLVSLSVNANGIGVFPMAQENKKSVSSLLYGKTSLENYNQSYVVKEIDNKVLFGEGMLDQTNICAVKNLESVLPDSVKENAKDFLDYTCQSEGSLNSPVTYCQCINKKNYKLSGKTLAANKNKIRSLEEEVYASKLAEIVNNALFSYLVSSESIGYAALANPVAREALKDANCKPGNFKSMLDKYSGESVKGRSCIEKLNNSKLTNLFKEKIETEKEKFARLRIGVDENMKGVDDIAFLADERISQSFKRDVNKIYERNIPLSQFDPINYTKFPDDIKKLTEQENQKISSIYELNQKILNKEPISDELYRRVQEAYLSNPLVRKIEKNTVFEKSNDISTKKTSPLFSQDNTLSFSIDKLATITLVDKIELEKIAKGFVTRLNSARRDYGGKKPIENIEEFLETHSKGLSIVAGKLNESCEESFNQIKEHCDKSEAQVLVDLDSEERTRLVDQYQASAAATSEEAKNAQVITGLLSCHMRNCANGDKNISDSCIEQAHLNVLDGKKVQISSSLNKPRQSKPSKKYDEVFDAEINLGDIFDERESSGRSVASVSPVSDTFNQDTGTSYNEPMIDTSFANPGESFAESIGTINPIGSINNSGSLMPSTLSGIDAAVAANEEIVVEEASPSAPRAQSAVDSKTSDELRKELENIKSELASSKDERDSTKKELEEFKTLKILDDQQRAMAEKEKAMRDNLVGLEEKIRRLESERVSVSQQLPTTKFSNPRINADSFEPNMAADYSRSTGTGANSISSGQKFSVNNSSTGKSAFSSRGAGPSVGVGQSVISLSSKDDPSLGAKVREAYKNGVETLYVTIGGNYYRVTPKKDNNGNLVLENGEVALNFEITTTEIAQSAMESKLPEGLLRAPAAVDDEDVLAPTVAGEEALRYSDLLSKLRDSK